MGHPQGLDLPLLEIPDWPGVTQAGSRSATSWSSRISWLNGWVFANFLLLAFDDRQGRMRVIGLLDQICILTGKHG